MPPPDKGFSGVGPLINVCNVRNAHAQIVDEESFYSSTGDRSNCDCCNILSILDLHGGKSPAHRVYSTPIHDRSSVSGTNNHPKGATTSFFMRYIVSKAG